MISTFIGGRVHCRLERTCVSGIDKYTDTHTYTHHDISYDVVLTVVLLNTREWGSEAQDNAQLTLQRFEL